MEGSREMKFRRGTYIIKAWEQAVTTASYLSTGFKKLDVALQYPFSPLVTHISSRKNKFLSVTPSDSMRSADICVLFPLTEAQSMAGH